MDAHVSIYHLVVMETFTYQMRFRGVYMAVKIKVSYEHEQELKKIIAMLDPIIKDIKPSKNSEGRYKKAYINLE